MSTLAPEKPPETDNDLDAERAADRDEVAGPEAPPPEKREIDRDNPPEQLALPMLGGEGVDRIRISHFGTVMLDRSDPRDVAFWNDLYRLGKGVELRVSADVKKVSNEKNTGRDGELDVNVGEIRLKIHTICVIPPEDLG